jgi:ribokinase
MSQVVVIGSANIDLTLEVDRLPKPGETVFGRNLLIAFGGKGANQAVAAHRAGAKVAFLGKVGRDRHGEEIRKHLEKIGIGEAGLILDQTCPTGVAFILVEPGGRNQIAVAPGCNYRLSPEEITAKDELFTGTVLLLQLETPLETVLYALKRGKEKGMLTILNPAPAVPLPPDAFPFVDLLTPNETEAAALAGLQAEEMERVEETGRRLFAKGCGDVIVTLGPRGALWVGKNGVEHFPPFPVASIDSTAAGDAFNGALAAALAKGRELQEAMRWANAAGALTTTRRGAQESLPTREEIERLLQA